MLIVGFPMWWLIYFEHFHVKICLQTVDFNGWGIDTLQRSLLWCLLTILKLETALCLGHEHERLQELLLKNNMITAGFLRNS